MGPDWETKELQIYLLNLIIINLINKLTNRSVGSTTLICITVNTKTSFTPLIFLQSISPMQSIPFRIHVLGPPSGAIRPLPPSLISLIRPL
jgi:hypothetical protein